MVQQGAFYTGIYRNVFKETGKTEEEVSTRLNEIFEELFYGDEDTKFYYPVGDDMAYIMDTGNNDARTEGMSYGMMMCVQMNKKEEFDRLWKWTMEYMYMDSGVHKGYFAWSVDPSGKKNSQGPAPDGEEYFAMALFFASKRWGNGPAPFDYSVKARELLRLCIHKGENDDEFPMWNRENKLIKFVPECEYTDPSYHLPHFYELFALFANKEDQEFWKAAAMASREFLKKACHPKTGFTPEYSFYDGSVHDNPNHRSFFSDAYRTIPNIALDYSWFAADGWEITPANTIQTFLAELEPEQDYKIYEVDGTVIKDSKARHPIGLLASVAEASLISDCKYSKEWVELFWNTPVRTGKRRYYDNCLYLFAFLALSGNYRIYA